MLGIILVVTACSSGSNQLNGAGTGTTAGGHQLRLGMALGGPKNDKGFSQACYQGLVNAGEQFSMKIQVRENVVDPQARIEALRDLAQSNDIVIGCSGAFAADGTQVAPQFPKVTFLMLNGETSDAPNLYAYKLREGVPAYIAGRVAAEVTKTNKIGFLGAEEIPPTIEAGRGFEAGVKASGKPIQFSRTIVGSFNDVEKARLAAAAMIKDGVDYVYSHLDQGIVGVVKAFQEAGSQGRTFEIIANRCSEFPNQLAGASVGDVTALVVKMVGDYINKQTPPNRLLLVGVQLPNVQRLELCPGFATPKLQKLVDDVTKGINDGTIKLPSGF